MSFKYILGQTPSMHLLSLFFNSDVLYDEKSIEKVEFCHSNILSGQKHINASFIVILEFGRTT